MRPVFSYSCSSAFSAGQVPRIDREHLLVGVDGAIVVAQPILPQLADLQAQPDRLIGVADHLRLLRQHVDQAIPRLRAPVQPLERVDRVDAALVGVQRALVGVHRLRRVAELGLVRVGEPQQDLHPRRRLRLALGVARERADQLAPPLLLAEEVLQRLQRADVRRIQLQRLLRRRDGVVDVAQRRVVPARDLHPQVGRLLGIGDPLHDLRVLADQLVPLVGRRRQPLQLLGDVVVRVVLAERRLQRDERAVAVVQLLFVDLGDLHQQHDARRHVGREVRAREQQLDQLGPSSCGGGTAAPAPATPPGGRRRSAARARTRRPPSRRRRSCRPTATPPASARRPDRSGWPAPARAAPGCRPPPPSGPPA